MAIGLYFQQISNNSGYVVFGMGMGNGVGS